VDSPPHIELSARAGPGFFCTNFFSLSDSLTLDWYPNFNAAPGQAEKLLRIRKGWTINPLDRLDNQQANPMLPNDLTTTNNFILTINSNYNSVVL
jgi:hypothetical protein